MRAVRLASFVFLVGLGVLLFSGVAVAPEVGVEGFESGNLPRPPWETGGDAPWRITPVARSGAYALQAGQVGDNGRSWIQIWFIMYRDGELSFWYKVSSEEGHDCLLLFVNDRLEGRWSGEIGWTQARVALGAGNYWIRWEYIKDGSDARGKDTAYLDDVIIAPPSAVPAAPAGMVLIPGGSFRMGDPFGEGDAGERPVHTVVVSAFFMDKFEVTKALWDEVATWAERNGYDIKPADGFGKARHHPVYNVSWYTAVKWANARSEKEGLTPCYYTDASHRTVYRTGKLDLTNDCVKWTANGYRLPTEAEWEKAARGGCEGRRFPWCDADTITHSRANYESDGGGSYDTSPTRGNHPTYKTGDVPYTSPAESFPANGYGLYDMAGNLMEWCWDWYGQDYYASSPGIDPRGPVSGSERVLRGGCWGTNAHDCRVAYRNRTRPGNTGTGLGLRLVLSLGP